MITQSLGVTAKQTNVSPRLNVPLCHLVQKLAQEDVINYVLPIIN